MFIKKLCFLLLFLIPLVSFESNYLLLIKKDTISDSSKIYTFCFAEDSEYLIITDSDVEIEFGNGKKVMKRGDEIDFRCKKTGIYYIKYIPKEEGEFKSYLYLKH
jgi:hypothetical protein